MIFKNRTYYLFVVSFTVVLFGCKKEKKVVEIKSDNVIFQSILDSIYDKNQDCIGLLVHIAAPEKNISWSGAVGIADTINKLKLQENHPVLIASNTKTYVAAATLRLVEENKISLDTAIKDYISDTSRIALTKEGYDLSEIKLKHLLSHSSGIFDYAGTNEFFERIIKDPKHRWTRDEQIALALSLGEPLGVSGEVFSYSDTNYLLLTEIIETITEIPFYDALRDLIGYEKINITSTWFPTLEETPKKSIPLAHQYFSSSGLSSYNVDCSFDLFGGGGLASNMQDLAVFAQNLFSNNVFKNPYTTQIMYGNEVPKVARDNGYFFGLSSVDYNEFKGYGHGGFWGTAVNYFPELNATISVAVLERDKRVLRVDVNEAYLKLLKSL